VSSFGSLILLQVFVKFLEMPIHPPPPLGDIKGLSEMQQALKQMTPEQTTRTVDEVMHQAFGTSSEEDRG
jgi:hypothetical protein